MPAGPGRGSQSLLFIDFGFPGPGPWRDSASTNQRPVLRSRDPAQPIRGQYSGHLIRRTGPEKASSELATIAHTQSHSLSRGNILTRDNYGSSSSVPQHTHRFYLIGAYLGVFFKTSLLVSLISLAIAPCCRGSLVSLSGVGSLHHREDQSWQLPLSAGL